MGGVPPESEVVDVQAECGAVLDPDPEADAVDERVVVECDCNGAAGRVGVDVDTRGGKAGTKAFAPGLKEKLN